MTTPTYAVTASTDFLALNRAYVGRVLGSERRTPEAALLALALPFWVFPSGAVVRTDAGRIQLDPEECLASPEAFAVLLPGGISPDRLHQALAELARDEIVRTREGAGGVLAVRHLPRPATGWL